MNDRSEATGLTTQEAIALARAHFVRETTDLFVAHALDRPLMKGHHVPADDSYYQRLAEAFIMHTQNCPSHAAQDIAQKLKQIEDFACQAVRGLIHLAPTPDLKKGDAERMRAANNARMDLAPGS